MSVSSGCITSPIKIINSQSLRFEASTFSGSLTPGVHNIAGEGGITILWALATILWTYTLSPQVLDKAKGVEQQTGFEAVFIASYSDCSPFKKSDCYETSLCWAPSFKQSNYIASNLLLALSLHINCLTAQRNCLNLLELCWVKAIRVESSPWIIGNWGKEC